MDAKAAAKAICDAQGEDRATLRTAQKWFKRFNEVDLDLEDRSRSGRPSILNEGDLQAALAVEPSSSTRELGEELGVDQNTVWNHFCAVRSVTLPSPSTSQIALAAAFASKVYLQ